MAEFETAVEVVLKHEGGYVNNPSDPGGETNMGISRRSYPDEDIKGMTEERAKQIYQRDFWLAGRFGEIQNQALATKIFDLSATMGVHRAVKLIQTAITYTSDVELKFEAGRPGVIACDGIMGPITLTYINNSDPAKLLDLLKREARAYYENVAINNPQEAEFLPGWLERADS
jgi:lysozyme family protein